MVNIYTNLTYFIMRYRTISLKRSLPSEASWYIGNWDQWQRHWRRGWCSSCSSHPKDVTRSPGSTWTFVAVHRFHGDIVQGVWLQPVDGVHDVDVRRLGHVGRIAMCMSTPFDSVSQNETTSFTAWHAPPYFQPGWPLPALRKVFHPTITHFIVNNGTRTSHHAGRSCFGVGGNC